MDSFHNGKPLLPMNCGGNSLLIGDAGYRIADENRWSSLTTCPEAFFAAPSLPCASNPSINNSATTSTTTIAWMNEQLLVRPPFPPTQSPPSGSVASTAWRHLLGGGPNSFSTPPTSSTPPSSGEEECMVSPEETTPSSPLPQLFYPNSSPLPQNPMEPKKATLGLPIPIQPQHSQRIPIPGHSHLQNHNSNHSHSSGSLASPSESLGVVSQHDSDQDKETNIGARLIAPTPPRHQLAPPFLDANARAVAVIAAQAAAANQPGKDPKAVDSTRYKTTLCRNFERFGVCPYGDICAYAHGSKELRTVDENAKVVASIAILAEAMSIRLGTTCLSALGPVRYRRKNRPWPIGATGPPAKNSSRGRKAGGGAAPPTAAPAFSAPSNGYHHHQSSDVLALTSNGFDGNAQDAEMLFAAALAGFLGDIAAN